MRIDDIYDDYYVLQENYNRGSYTRVTAGALLLIVKILIRRFCLTHLT